MFARFLLSSEICEFFAPVLEDGFFVVGHILLGQELVDALDEKLTAKV